MGEVLDLTKTDPDLRLFRGGFSDGKYGYLVPDFNFGRFSKVARFRLDTFSDTEILDLTRTDRDLRGFKGGFIHGEFAYLVPYYNGNYFGKVARFRLSTFAETEVLDLTETDKSLVGFVGGFSDGTYGYLVPYANNRGYAGKVARFRLDTFGQTEVLDLCKVNTECLRGFKGGFSDGTYGYLVPEFTQVGKGRVVRFNLKTFGQTEVLNLAETDPDLTGFKGGFTDGTYGYLVPYYNGKHFGKVARFHQGTFSNTEVLDLTLTDSRLRGFVDGFLSGSYGYLVPYSYVTPKGLDYSGRVVRFQVKEVIKNSTTVRTTTAIMTTADSAVYVVSHSCGLSAAVSVLVLAVRIACCALEFAMR